MFCNNETTVGHNLFRVNKDFCKKREYATNKAKMHTTFDAACLLQLSPS